MDKCDTVRLRHMLDAAREVLDFTRGLTRGDLDGDRKLVLALVKDIEIIGEAAHQVSESGRGQLPDVPWEDMIGMRHRLVHAYFDISLDVLWQTIQEDVPALVALLKPQDCLDLS